MVVGDLLLLGFLRLLAASLHNLDVVIENCSNHRDHIGLDHPRPDILRAANSYVHDTLKSQIPFPHIHHIFAAALLQDTHQPLNAPIDCQDVANPRRRGGEIREMVERVDQGQGRSAVQGTPIVEGSGDAHRCLIDIRDAEVDFSHLDNHTR